MPRIPRIEQTVPYRAAEMPFSSGDGYQAPGRALQKLGSAIADAGKGFASLAAGMEGEADKENDFKDKMTMLQYKNDIHLNEVEARNAYTGDGSDYAQSRAQFYQDRSAETLAKISPKNRQWASLQIESGRGSFVGSAAEHGHSVRRQTLYSDFKASLTGEVGKLQFAGDDPDVRMQRFETTLAATEAMINDFPGTPQQKDALREHARQQLEGFIQKMDPLDLGRVNQLRERLGTLQPQTTGPGEPGKVGGQMHQFSGPQREPKWPIYYDKTPTAAERSAIFRKGGVVVNLDTNWAPSGRQTTPMVVIPDNASPAQRQAAQAYASGIAQIYKQKFGASLEPKVVTRSQNGRGRNATIHTEPFSVNDGKAVDFFTSPEGRRLHANLLGETFGKVPGVHFSLPHDPYRKGDNGAQGPKGNEVQIARAVLNEMRGLGGPQLQEGPTQVAEGTTREQPSGPDRVTVSLKGLTDEQKAAKLDELGRQGYRSFSYRFDDNERLIAKKADKFAWTPSGRGPTDAPAGSEGNDVLDSERFSGPGWATEPIGKFQRGEYDRKDNTIPGGTQVADASGQTGGVVRKGGSVAGMLLESINKQLPAIQERHAKAVGALVESVEKRAREGYMPTDEELAKVRGYVDGLGMPEMTARLDLAVQMAEETSKLQRRPPDQVAKIAQGLRAELAAKGKKATAGELAQVDFLESLADNTRKALDKDQIGHAIAVGLVPAQEPLDPRNLSVEQMMARKGAAEVAAETFGRPVKYFSADEKIVFAEAMNQGGTPLLGTLKTIYEALGPDTPKLMAEFGKEAPEAATLGWLVANGQRQQVLTDIADGLQLIRSDGFKSRIPKATDLRTEAGTVIGNAFVETPKAQQAVIDTARVLYEWRAHRKGLDPKDSIDTDLWEQSVREVLGEREFNGEKFGGVYEQKTGGWLGIGGTATNAIIPTNVKQDKFKSLIDSIRLGDLLPNEAVPPASPGVPVPPGDPGIPFLAQSEFARNSQEGEAPKGKAGQITSAAGLSVRSEQRAYPIMDREGKPLSVKAIRQSKLVTVGPGRYLMALGDPLAEDPEYIMGRDGEPYMLDLNELEPRLRLRNPTYYAPE